jgi:sirohydrochlorin cobaltochelatase
MEPSKDPALILFAHGSRDPDWALPFLHIQRSIQATRKDLIVELAFLESSVPTLEETITRIVGLGRHNITIAPLFMAQGGHLKQDLPRIIKALCADHPGIHITVLPPIGEVPAILDAISGWIVSAIPSSRV